jgi:dinuclear metal center YbgI/SA1388 family protein
MLRTELADYLNRYLSTDDFSDCGPNGLQVEGRDEVKYIVTSVSASVELFEKAIEMNADAIIVHHGIIWDFERPVYRGGYKQRVKLLLENDINLFAYHLPLDAHPEVGNNFQIARTLDLKSVEPFGDYKGKFVGCKGQVNSIPSDIFISGIKEKINPDALVFPYGSDRVRTIGIISGGAQKEVKQAVLNELDLYITGEATEFILHYVKEERIHYVAAGHYATEKFGIIALGKHLTEQFDLQVEFIDIPNPV